MTCVPLTTHPRVLPACPPSAPPASGVSLRRGSRACRGLEVLSPPERVFSHWGAVGAEVPKTPPLRYGGGACVSSRGERLFSCIRGLGSNGKCDKNRSPPHHSLETLFDLSQLGKFTSQASFVKDQKKGKRLAQREAERNSSCLSSFIICLLLLLSWQLQYFALSPSGD